MICFFLPSNALTYQSKTVSKHVFLNLTIFSVLLILSNIKVLSGLKCVCSNDCDPLRENDCPGSITWDPCKCCKVCSKVEGETCGGLGGFSGMCEPPLKCISKPPIIGTGVCLNLPPHASPDLKHHSTKNPNCKQTVSILPGCEIVDRKCQCWHKTISVCKENHHFQWDFTNIEECELNLANLIQSEVDFDEDYTIPPKYELVTTWGKRRKNMVKKIRKRKPQISN